jgi:DNA-binding NarL/FixJ family response regulator
VQLREAVEAVIRGETWGIESDTESQPLLSHREQEIVSLLSQGLRDRDIANRLIIATDRRLRTTSNLQSTLRLTLTCPNSFGDCYISESTVKFHMNNVLGKLRARTRYQALHQAIVNGWIQ